MKQHKHILIYAAACFSLISCGSVSDDKSDKIKPQIAVSIEPQRNIAEAIAGDDYIIITVLENGANPETFEPSMTKRVDADNSAAYLTIGAFTFENTLINSLSNKVKVFNTADGIEAVYGTHVHAYSDRHHHAHDDRGDDADPHVWTSAKNMKIIATNIAHAACKINPDNAQKYKSRLDSICLAIDSIDMAIAARIAEAPSKSFLIWHPSLSYLARDYGLEQIAVGQESKEMSPRQLRDIIDHAEKDKVSVFFFQKEFDSRQAETINQRIGTRLVSINPLAYEWAEQLNLIADELSKQ